MDSVRCGKCGSERPAGARGPCPKCLLQLGLESSITEYEQIGPYRIVNRLGSGGMGNVYRARDTRLGRDVAIKVLHDRLASDPERIGRFRREARVAASLNHPNISAIYGFEEVDEAHFLVMELVEGRSLASRLRAGAIPIDESLEIVEQIAEGLEAAHDNGIVHRDLKPSNVMLTPDGKAKILDFGVAKALDDEAVLPDLEHSPTISAHATTPGMLIGTVPYMSPEQARGRPVDRRADIWALGCVLYECLTGRRAFGGDTAPDVLAKVLERDPDWSARPARTPGRVRELLQRCLEKDLKRRIRDSGDARIELERAREAREWTSTGPVAALPAEAGAGARALRAGLPWGIAAVAVLIAAAALGPSIRISEATSDGGARKPQAVQLKADVTDPEVPRFPSSDISTLAITSDGMTIAYVGRAPAGNWFESSIYVRRADDIHAVQRIDSTRRGHEIDTPFFSPDGKWIGFSNSGLYKMAVTGGERILIAESLSTGGTRGAVWTDRGIVFSPAAKAGLVRIGDNGGALETLTVPDLSKGEVSHRWPSALPDGRHILFTIKREGITSFDEGEIALLDLATKSWKTILRGGSFARYLPTGHIVYARSGAIFAVPFDLRSESVTGPPMTVLANVMTEPGSGAAQFDVAQDAGALLFVPGGSNIRRRELVWLDRTGRVAPVGAPLAPYYRPLLSADGTRIAATVFGATDIVVVYDIRRGSSMRAKTEGNCTLQSWHPDGRQLLVSSDAAGGAQRLVLTSVDGEGPSRDLDVDVAGSDATLLARTAGGTAVVSQDTNALWLTAIDGDGGKQRLTGFGEVTPARPALSRDGRWLAYDTDVSGRREVEVRPFPAGNGTWQLSRGGGSQPFWSPRGDEVIYFRETGGTAKWLMSVHLSMTAAGISPGPPQDLMEVPDGLEVSGLDPEGRRILALRDVPRQYPGDRVFEILDWFDQVAEKDRPR